MSFSETLRSAPENLLVPSKELADSTLAEIKNALDPIAKKYSIFDGVHVDGLDAEQVWAQAQMIVDGAVEKLYGKLSELVPQIQDEEDEPESGSEDLSEVPSDEEQSEDEMGELGDLEEVGEHGELNSDDFEAAEMHDDFDEQDFEGFDEEASGPEAGSGSGSDKEEQLEGTVAGLNSGLFDLQEFQQQVLAMENEDFGEDDDGEEIDYSKPQEARGEEEDHFNDFFAAPKKKNTKKDKQAFAEDQEVEDAFGSARKDLFDDEDDIFSDQAETENLSKFERQQLELQKQIEQLESENVGEKEWAVKGEVRASQRPADSLINTELEFERNAKPAPVITQEVTDSLEDMIRERIKKQEFDDLPRRTQVTKKPKKELAELSEQKSEKSLAEQYEDDQNRAENPEYYKSKDGAALTAAHKEITELFSVLTRKLDALSSWNYTPKAPKPSLSITADVAAVSMEEAQPTAAATEQMLAPQEVYSTKQVKGEVTGRNNLPQSREEMTTEEKLRARRKSKAANKKKEQDKPAAPKATPETKGSKQDMFDTLKKGNVSYVDKRGQKRDLRGNVVTEKKSSSSHLKL